jgi:hypothetical protein
MTDTKYFATALAQDFVNATTDAQRTAIMDRVAILTETAPRFEILFTEAVDAHAVADRETAQDWAAWDAQDA